MSVLLTATFTRLDGSPASGTVRVTPSRSPIMDPGGQIIISGPQTFSLDKDGKLNAEIQASNDPDLGAPFTYTIDVHLTHATWKIARVWIPHGTPSVDLSTIADYTPLPGEPTRLVTIPADGVDGQVLVWDGAGFTWMDVPPGPQGPPGEVTTAALTAALAGKVTGTGLTLRHDTTVGTRVLLDHPGGTLMLHGDTGWRDISGLLENGWTGSLRIRRVGPQIFLAGQDLTPGTSTVLIPALPTVWRPHLRTPLTAQIAGSTPLYARVHSSGSVQLDISSSTIRDLAGSWSVTHAWPTTHLGTPTT